MTIMPENNKIVEPNFEGEKMRMPENIHVAAASEESKTSVINGPLLIGLAIILVLILGGLYYWFGSLNQNEMMQLTPEATRPTAEENNEPESATAEAQVDITNIISPSDEIDAIEADIEATDMESLDAQIQAVDNEIDDNITSQ